MAAMRRWYNPAAILRSLILRPRAYIAALVGIGAFLLCSPEWPGTIRVSLAWDIGGLTYLILAFHLMITCGPAHMRAAAAHRDESRLVILILVLLSIAASFVSIAQLIGHAKLPEVERTEKGVLAALAMATIIISWGITQVAFAIHYAHEFYRPEHGSDARGGLLFPGCEVPDYWDFLYFATSIGATSQTSDTSIRSRNLRRLVTLHAIIAFFFNTAVLALTVNIAASLA